MRDSDMRLEALRLANVILRLADEPEAKHEVEEGTRGIGDLVVSSGSDRLVTRWETHCQQIISGSDSDGPIAIGFDVDQQYVRGRHTLLHGPKDFVEVATQIIEAMSRHSLRTDGMVLILGDDTAWRNATEMIDAASGAHPDLEMRLSHGVKGHELDVTTKSLQSVTAIGSDLAEAVAALPPRPMLTWNRAESGQALAKRRANGVPPMGRAVIRPAALKWMPHDGAPHSDGAAHIVRPALAMLREPHSAIPDDRRFEWTLDDWQQVTFLSRIDHDVQRAIIPALRATDANLLNAPRFLRRARRWIQRDAPKVDPIEITYAEADILLDRGVLQKHNDMLVPTDAYHYLMGGLIASGYESWHGVKGIERVSHVPQGIKYEYRSGDYLGYSYDRLKRLLVRLTDDGFTIEPIRFDKMTPTVVRKAYAASGLSPDEPVIAVVMYGGLVWPDWNRDIRAEMEGRLGIRCDPGLDQRQLPGPLGELYRAPPEDRLLVERYLRWVALHDQLPNFYEDWVDLDSDY